VSFLAGQAGLFNAIEQGRKPGFIDIGFIL
jgi:hypothetical protein